MPSSHLILCRPLLLLQAQANFTRARNPAVSRAAANQVRRLEWGRDFLRCAHACLHASPAPELRRTLPRHAGAACLEAFAGCLRGPRQGSLAVSAGAGAGLGAGSRGGLLQALGFSGPERGGHRPCQAPWPTLLWGPLLGPPNQPSGRQGLAVRLLRLVHPFEPETRRQCGAGPGPRRRDPLAYPASHTPRPRPACACSSRLPSVGEGSL